MKRSACRGYTVVPNQTIPSWWLWVQVPSPPVRMTCWKKGARAGFPACVLAPPG